ncbi:hypothetical protein Cs7R123_13130 [Catellatospora sp. TT07R-123]|uniref:TY-Chap domain-containing protein n=1 Tax=Catellatospora sp. TT07R-123 TaxID=2733863 RepID=UPI001B2B7BAE|nr:hypothetical protein [Catellatospora sp. TT07R-123]GHJ43971.1 hypothetical protein Cs7R123_13130 [Catellatospora sp. TT07R-123]
MTGWDGFAKRLRQDLAQLSAGDTVLLRHGYRIVQFQQLPRLLRAEVVSNAFLPPEEQLDQAQQALLTADGWHAPAGRNDPNWSFDLPWPATSAQYDELTARLVTALRDVIGAAAPADLTVEAWNDGPTEPIPLDLAICG